MIILAIGLYHWLVKKNRTTFMWLAGTATVILIVDMIADMYLRRTQVAPSAINGGRKRRK